MGNEHTQRTNERPSSLLHWGIEISTSFVECLNEEKSIGDRPTRWFAYLLGVGSNDFFDVSLVLQLSSLEDPRFTPLIVKIGLTEQISGSSQTRSDQVSSIVRS